MRCAAFVIEQRTVGNGDDARAAVDGETTSGAVNQTVRMGITNIDIENANDISHSRAVSGVLDNRGIAGGKRPHRNTGECRINIFALPHRNHLACSSLNNFGLLLVASCGLIDHYLATDLNASRVKSLRQDCGPAAIARAGFPDDYKAIVGARHRRFISGGRCGGVDREGGYRHCATCIEYCRLERTSRIVRDDKATIGQRRDIGYIIARQHRCCGTCCSVAVHHPRADTPSGAIVSAPHDGKSPIIQPRNFSLSTE